MSAGARAAARTRQVVRAQFRRLPTRVQVWTRTLARRRVQQRVPAAKRTPALVTIVLPVYNVERYLKPCLDSILSQTYEHLQVVAVDDGSPDRSIDILQAYAAEDPRLEIVRQPNAGLGAARNVGAGHARGRYLMFVDSDDVLRPGAVAAYVQSLEASGSDFAVSAYERLSPAGTVAAAPWVRMAHRQLRQATTVQEFPDIQVNAVAWSKMYRRSFWQSKGFTFPTGVLYEDQAVSARAYASATGFDVLNQVTYQWRVRDDRSSITQQNHGVPDLSARFAAASSSLDELTALGATHARDVRLAQLLSNDLPLSIKASQHASDEFWLVLRAGLKEITALADEETWRRVPAQHRLAVQLVLNDKRDELVQFIGLQRNNPKSVPALVSDGQIYFQFSAREPLGLEPLSPMLAAAEQQLGLVTGVRRLFWDDAGHLELHGWAYLDNVDLAGFVPTTTLLLVDLDHPDEEPVRVTTELMPTPAVSAQSKHQYANYESSAFRAVVDPAALRAHEGLGRWSVQVHVQARGMERTALMRGLQLAGSSGHLAGRHVDGRHVTPSNDKGRGLLLTVVRPLAVVARAELSGRELTVDLTPAPGFEPVELIIKNSMTGARLAAPVKGQPSTRVALTVPDVPPPAGSKTGTTGVEEDESPPLPRELWTARVRGADGRSGTLSLTQESELLGVDGPLRLRMTQGGNLGLVEDRCTLVVDAVVAGPDETLVVEGRWFGPAGGELELRLAGPRGGCAATVAVGEERELRAILHLVGDPWGTGVRPLASGDYDLKARWRAADLADDADPVAVDLRADYRAIATLPVLLRSELLRGAVQLAGSDRLRLQLEPPLRDDELGARNQRRLADELAARVSDPGFERGAVLFRSYYGEVCACNPLAVHQELRRLGTDHTLYWTVRDHSVAVPEGGVPVIYESAEWYRLLHDAEFYMDNMHQSIYHVKPAHQVEIQTFHGYPFKAMGQSHWNFQRRDVAHIQSYLQRAADWDYFVSPASYATEMLKKEFGYPADMLAIGYPRNDVLQSPRADEVRSHVRSLLGIRDDQTVVLYAPTFRDHLARNDFRAVMTDFFDPRAVADRLGDDYVVLVRGHAFHARESGRVASDGNVIDVTDYPDINDLCLVSDCAVLDYSSLRFDYGLTGKPMIYLVPDLQEYVQQSRGTLLDYEPTAPGPMVSTTAEVIDKVADLDGLRQQYADQYATFRRTFLDLDDGHATERLVQEVFGK